MKRIFIGLSLLVLAWPVLVSAQTRVQQRIQDPASVSGTPSPQGNQIQNQNQVRNQGEETQLQNQQQQALQDMGANAPEAAVQRRSQVANAVQAMLQVADRDAKIGPQIREIAQMQNQNQVKLEAALQKIQSRGALARFFMGPDHGQINETQRMLEQNRLKIQELNQIKTQLVNKTDEQKLEQQIQLLEQVNVQFQNALNQSAGGFSLFGWMFRLFAR